jgi:hypothetical protein
MNGSAGLHLLYQAKDLFASPYRPDFLPQRFEPLQVDWTLAFVGGV